MFSVQRAAVLGLTRLPVIPLVEAPARPPLALRFLGIQSDLRCLVTGSRLPSQVVRSLVAWRRKRYKGRLNPGLGSGGRIPQLCGLGKVTRALWASFSYL